MPTDAPTRFKSRFSLLSLLPSRHPPLIVGHPDSSASAAPSVPDLPAVPSRYRLPPTQRGPEQRPALQTPGRARASLRAQGAEAGAGEAEAEETSSCLSASTPSSISTSDDGRRGGGRRYGGKARMEELEGEELMSPPILGPLKAMSPFAAALQGGQQQDESPSQKKEKKRPAPIDIERVRKVYPPSNGSKPRRGLTLIPVDTKAPGLEKALPEVQAETVKLDKPTKKGRKPPPKPIKVVDDPFDFAIVDVGHKYTSWQGGKVDIRPGEIIPPHLLEHARTRPAGQAIRGETAYGAETEIRVLEVPGESVLHDVLLTPTYLAPSPHAPTTASPSPSPLSRASRRRTLLDKAAFTLASAARRSGLVPLPLSRGILKHVAGREEDREMAWSLRRIRSKEELEMERFRAAVAGTRPGQGAARKKPTFLDEVAWGEATGVSPSPESDRSGMAARSPSGPGRGGEGQARGGGWGRVVSGRRAEEEKGWKVSKEEEEKAKKRKRMMRYGLAIILMVACALIIGLCTSLLTRSPSSSSPTSDSSPSSPPDSAGQPANIQGPSQSLTSCLSAYGNSSVAPLSYPCSDCAPVLRQAENDFAFPLVNGNSTNVGAALQLCALVEVYQATGEPSGLLRGGWGKGTVCNWDGVTCDSRGRVSGFSLQYPDVPDRLPDLSALVALVSIAITGNNTVPAGDFPAALLSNGALTSIDIQYAPLQGSLASMDFSKSSSLQTLRLVNVPELGNALPDLSGNTQLGTLTVTGQGLKGVNESKLPQSLTYLDLSYNSLGGTVPSLSSMASLTALYLTNNAYTAAPASLPGSLQTLQLASNPSLTGQMPQAVCSNTQLTSCDLRNTKLSGSAASSSVVGTPAGPALANSSSEAIPGTQKNTTSTPVLKPTSAVLRRAESCGVCLFS